MYTIGIINIAVYFLRLAYKLERRMCTTIISHEVREGTYNFVLLFLNI